MRILVQIRPNFEQQEGGDTAHAVRTAEELRKLGLDAEISGSLAPDLSRYDLVHVFNTELVEPTFRHVLRARGGGVPVVLTPIFWREPLEDESFAARDRENLARREHVMRQVVFGLAAAMLPNSEAEIAGIAKRFPAVPSLVDVVPTGVDERFARGDGDAFCRRYDLPPRGFVLCAARREERKNQLRLIAACAKLPAPLVLAGAEYEDRLAYAAACRELAENAGGDVRFLPHLSADEMADAYAAARVHALPSIWETVGLASLEAALAGCNVVSTKNCGVPEYLGERAWYCDPESEVSIHGAVSAAFAAPLDGELSRHVAGFTWEEAAKRTLAVYERVMDERSGEPTRSWRAALSPEQYIEHLESLVQLQLETIAMRDAHYANVRESAERGIEYAQSLEEERLRREEYVKSLEQRPSLGRRLGARLRRLGR